MHYEFIFIEQMDRPYDKEECINSYSYNKYTYHRT